MQNLNSGFHCVYHPSGKSDEPVFFITSTKSLIKMFKQVEDRILYLVTRNHHINTVQICTHAFWVNYLNKIDIKFASLCFIQITPSLLPF